MSVFDNDIVEKEIEYLPDPYMNMEFQFKRYFKILSSHYKESHIWASAYCFKRDFEKLLDKINIERPSWWRGDFTYIHWYEIHISEHIDLKGGVNMQIVYGMFQTQTDARYNYTAVVDFYVPLF